MGGKPLRLSSAYEAQKKRMNHRKMTLSGEADRVRESTPAGLMKRAAAICLLVLYSAISSRTWRSVGVSASGLDDGLIRARLLAEGPLQGRISAQPGVDFTQAVRARQNGDERIEQFIQRRVADRLLLNGDGFSDRLEQAERAELEAEGCESRAR